MIEAQDFVEPARARGFRFYAGVPCSFFTDLVNYAVGDDRLTYSAAANEGDAVASALGAHLGGARAVAMMQNSGLGNAVNPLTSLAHVFRLPALLIVTLRGDPALSDEPQHALMGRITPALLEAMEIPWAYFPSARWEVEPALAGADAHLAQAQRPYALVMRKGSLAPCGPAPRAATRERAQSPLRPRAASLTRPVEARPARADALARVVELTAAADTVVVATTGYTGRELYALADRPSHLYMVGSMGCVASLGLGLALARPDLRVVVIDGDGAALMRLGNFATVGAYGGSNLVHLLLDNEVHDSTGAQPTVSAGMSFAGVAEACGYAVALAADELGVIDDVLARGPVGGPRFAQIKIRAGTPEGLPRPRLSPVEVRRRFTDHIGPPIRGR